MAILCFFFLVCGLRTNLAFEYLFFTIMIALALVAAALWKEAEGRADTARQCAKVSLL